MLVGQAFPQQPSMTILRPPQTGRSNQNGEHSAFPLSSSYHEMCDNIISHLYTTKILHWKENWFVYPWGAFATFKYSAASLAHQPQVCSCSAAKSIQQWVPGSERINLFLTLPPSLL